ncbi:MAG: glycoside hydrolase family 16 protein [Candidatus Saccharimonadales bacterium]
MAKAKLLRLGGVVLVVLISLTLIATGIYQSIGGTHMSLTWSDEFDGPAGTPPDARYWSFVDNQPPGGGNQELEYYIPDASALDGQGRLAITTARDNGRFPAWYGPSQFTSGKIWTRGKVEFIYGHLEVRAQFPAAGQPGSWPAIWLLGADIPEVGWPACGEIDMMESFGVNASKTEFSSSLHTPTDNPTFQEALPANDDLTGWHNYALDWQPGVLTFSVDGKAYVTYRKADFKTWPFDKPFFLILNNAIGGTMGGSVPAGAPLPYVMNVSYARLYNAELSK